jgi:hypothetical protein
LVSLLHCKMLRSTGMMIQTGTRVHVFVSYYCDNQM